MKNYVVISRANELDFTKDCVQLAKNYGTVDYYSRKDVKELTRVINENLNLLNEKTGFLNDLKGRKVILKPNLVTVFHDMGFEKIDYPETTDPRVLDALIRYIKPYAQKIVIGESSGRGIPTEFSFKNSGLTRLAEKLEVELIALEEQPVKRYILPKAKVMKEILLPELYVDIVENDAYYISVPKMKTNLYTGVTLGFKNAMGVIPYNLRQRNHNHHINDKLVDILYILKPNLTIIDGIVGGEGNTPAPVEPVDSRMIVSGTNAVETDRVATSLMGINPNKNKLILEASRRGFGDKTVEVMGTQKVVKFKKANPSLLSEEFSRQFPNVKYLLGFGSPTVLGVNSPRDVSLTELKKMEKLCDGGCIPSIRTALDYVKYQGHPTDFSITIIAGNGFSFENDNIYFDRDGKIYNKENVAKMTGKKLAMGTCTQGLADVVDEHIMGCMPKPSEPVIRLFSLIDKQNRMINPHKNKTLVRFGLAMLKLHRVRKKMIKKGIWIDCLPPLEDKIYGIRELTPEERNLDYIPWPLPKMTEAVKNLFLEEEKLSIKDFL